ncbi:cytochrome P450 72A15 [Aplysia californica]|uniref:Cytochrome P450 72A15 n=1 Tax=Aplysia californica TaxID=6500 RepID=A0ABM0JGS0_APLCA|nr:cytochrome P450 72A15 [Aplysia californica]
MVKAETVRHTLPYVAAAVGSWYFYKLFIRPFLSPLRKMPGRPYKPLIGNMFEALKEEALNSTIRWMTECKSRIIRFYFLYGEERVLVADPEIVKHIMVTNSKNYVDLSSQNLNSIVPGFLLTLSGEEHHALRKIINPSFNSQTVNDFIPDFEEFSRKVVRDWVEELKKSGSSSATVAAQNYMGRLTLDVICRCGFDYDMKAVEDPENAAVQSFRRILQGFQIRLSQMLPLQWLPTKKNRQAWADFKFFRATIAGVLQEKQRKLEQGDSSKDLLSLLLLARDEQGNALSDECLSSQVGGFLFAGFETTSMNLTWTLLQLAEHPDIQEKARQEVMSYLQEKNQPITVEVINNLQYLTCVIKESLRLIPPVGVVFRKALQPDILGGYPVPAGTPVGVSIGALHRLESNWEDPLTFKPERFLEKYDYYKFLPFGAGPYMCIGHIFSLTESKVVLATLLRNFRMSLPPGYKYKRIRQLTIQPKPPLELVIEPL